RPGVRKRKPTGPKPCDDPVGYLPCRTAANESPHWASLSCVTVASGGKSSEENGARTSALLRSS
ncbi:MAG: hypothetical protein BJ554DRAFT_6983, partial [Olpidium bornovanus]